MVYNSLANPKRQTEKKLAVTSLFFCFSRPSKQISFQNIIVVSDFPINRAKRRYSRMLSPTLTMAIRRFSISMQKSNAFAEELQKNFIRTNQFQKTLLSAGSAAISLFNPWRGDMIACLGEVTGGSSIKYMKEKMLQTPEGTEILKEMPRINSETVSFDHLSNMPENTLGRVYADFMKENNITADSRLPVQFIEDPELAYVMQRYREVHDLVHASLFMKTNMLGEVAVKWVEGIQTKLPMCISGGIWGAARLKPKHRQLYRKCYLPWAIRTGHNAKFLQGVYFEKRWDQDIEEFHKEMNIFPLLKK